MQNFMEIEIVTFENENPGLRSEGLFYFYFWWLL